MRIRAVLALAPLLAATFLHCGGSDEAASSDGDASAPPPPRGTAEPTPTDASLDTAPQADASADGSADGSADAGTEASTDAGTDAAVRYLPSQKDLNHALCTGQSLSVGAKGTPVLSLMQPYDNKMFNTGVRVTGGANLTQLLPLVEATLETMSSSFASLVT